MSVDDRFAGLSKDELQHQYDEATRNLTVEQQKRIESAPQQNEMDSDHVALVKALYRALTPYVAGNGHWDASGFQAHA